MTANQVSAFLSCLEKSRLLSADQCERARLLGPDTDDARHLAERLEKLDWLTPWQSRQLIGGRHRLTLGKYRLLEQIGASDTGAVFLADHAQMSRRVAIKLLSDGPTRDPEVVERFLAAARLAASLDHRNIVQVFDIDAVDDRYFIVMEHVAGSDLQSIVNDGGALPIIDVARAVHQAATALEFAHRRGAVHRHLNPRNLLIDEQGDVKILGFALGGLGAESSVDPLQRSYEPPPDAAGGDGDFRADIYSLGCVAFFLCTGVPPAVVTGNCDGAAEKRRKLKRRLKRDVPAALVECFVRMISADPAERQQSMDEIARELGDWIAKHSSRGDRKCSDSGLPLNPKGRWKTSASDEDEVDETDHGSVSDTDLRRDSSVDTLVLAERHRSGGDLPPPIPRGETVAPRIETKRTVPHEDKTATASGTPQPDAGLSSPRADRERTPGGGLIRERRREPVVAIVGIVTAVVLSLLCVSLGVAWIVRWSGGGDEVADASGRDAADAIDDDSPSTPFPFAGGEADRLKDSTRKTENVSGGAAKRTSPAPSDPPGDRRDPDGERQRDDAAESSDAVPFSTADRADRPEPGEERRDEKPSGSADAADGPNEAAPSFDDSDVFRGFPASVDLPPADEGAHVPIALGTIRARPDTQFHLALVGGEHAIRGAGRLGIGLASDGDWEVRLRGSPGSDDPVIAVFALTADGLLAFRWTTGGDLSSASGGLRNCVLRIAAGSVIHDLRLRAPLRVPALSVNLEGRASKETIPLLDPPDPAYVHLEITRVEGFPPSRYEPSSTFPADKGGVSIVMGSSGDEHSLLMRVDADMRRILSLSVMPRYVVVAGQAPERYHHTRTKKFASDLVAARTGVHQAVERMKRLRSAGPSGAEKERLDQQIKLGQEQLEQNDAAIERIKKLLALGDQVDSKAAIHFRVYYDTGDVPVELAQSR